MKTFIIDTGSTSGLIALIRQLVNEPLLHSTFMSSPNYYRLCSSMDVIEDSEAIIRSYEAGEYCSTMGARYLILYGLLQALFVQIGGVKSLAASLELPTPIEGGLEYVERIRSLSIGHPTNYKVKGKGNTMAFSFISRHSLSKSNFRLSYYDAQNSRREVQVDIPKLLKKTEENVSRQLHCIYISLLEMFRAKEMNQVPKGSLTNYFESLDIQLNELKLQLGLDTEFARRLKAILNVKKIHTQFVEALEALGRKELLDQQDLSIATDLNWLKDYMLGGEEPNIHQVHYAHITLDYVTKRMLKLGNLAKTLEGQIEADNFPVIDIALPRLRTEDLFEGNGVSNATEK